MGIVKMGLGIPVHHTAYAVCIDEINDMFGQVRAEGQRRRIIPKDLAVRDGAL